MKNVIRFLMFIVYAACLFLIPNHPILFLFAGINFIVMLVARVNSKKVFHGTLKILPFIIFTLLINCLLDDVLNALWVAFKLLLVCHITMTYANTTTAMRSG